MYNRRLVVMMLIVGIVFLAGALGLWLVLQPSTAGSSNFPVGALTTQQAGPYPEIWRVKLDAAKTAFDQKTAVFLDVRGSQFYTQAHIPGALVMNNDIPAQEVLSLARDTWIIPYCT